ncbi:hypothetical protein SCAZ3_01060 [Streptococcus canis FSL Z3-227]|uniref:Uncharacterized protein n=1 Tax=Streptococcus canis FSL Z3-227 TaxID=482234 RepID=A0AAV3FPF5_STRCB|nr:hypothetical protein SCAZ3_01060 [Streptococcus canis FSL Z3-227]VEE24262.1 Uncharacterised protein [Streptococcus canis]VTS71010.1 Uncharacterised protein [Streptococcus canis]
MIAQTLFISFIILEVTEGGPLYDVPIVPQKTGGQGPAVFVTIS